MLAAAASGSGKTTFVCALLRALVVRGTRVASFKCGPDYIDPMFHRESVGTSYSANLDLFFSDGATARRLLASGAEGTELAVIEGVMGYYDGVASTTEASSYALAREMKTPVALIVNCRGMSVSAAAQVKGFMAFREDANIACVLLNNLPTALYPEIKALIEHECGIPVAGYLPVMSDCALESRHLGLVTAAEVSCLQEKLDRLARQAEETIDIELLLDIAERASDLYYSPLELPRIDGSPVIAVARDEAFCFYYTDSLKLLEDMGARVCVFSPLRDRTIPENASALYLGGGYPELYAAALSENEQMCKAVKNAVYSGMPTIAECGGFMYLHRAMEDIYGAVYPMAGVIKADCFKTEKLRRFGYASLTAKQDNMLCKAGETLAGHEFHYWDSTDAGTCFTAQKPHRKAHWDCVHAEETLFAGYPHLYLAGQPESAWRFLQAAAAYQRGLGL